MTKPVIDVQGLSLEFHKPRGIVDYLTRRPRQVVKALNGVSLQLKSGETLGVVGESGCGKSTLARCIVRLYEPQQGSIRYHGKDIFDTDARKDRSYNRRVQMMFQDPYSSLNPRMTAGQILSEALQVHDMRPKSEIPGRVAELLDLVRLSADAADKLPHEFSGGQRQRIAIARALAVEPEVLIADELVSALDVSVQAQVVNLLLELQEKLDLTILFVAHDLRLVRHMSNRVAVIYLGRIVEIGDSETLFSAPPSPLFPSPAERCTVPRSRRQEEGHSARRRVAITAQCAARMSVSHPLPIRHRPLQAPCTLAEADRGCRRRCLPPRGRHQPSCQIDPPPKQPIMLPPFVPKWPGAISMPLSCPVSTLTRVSTSHPMMSGSAISRAFPAPRAWLL